MNRTNRKRDFQETRNRGPSKKTKQFHEKFQVVNQVRSQKGIRSRIVFMHGLFNVEPLIILNNSIDRINATLNVKSIGAGAERETRLYALYINNEKIVEGSYHKDTVARKELAKLAVDELKKTCFTVCRKIRPRDSPAVSVNCDASTSTDEVPKVSGFGAKMLLSMGWTGGGLGAQEQGITEIIKPTVQINREGLGTKHTVPVEEIKRILQEYASSDNINSISFSPEFTKEERVIMHSLAQKMNLKSSSYGNGTERRLVIQKKINPWQLINSLLEVGGENEQYQLILPTKFAKITKHLEECKKNLSTKKNKELKVQKCTS